MSQETETLINRFRHWIPGLRGIVRLEEPGRQRYGIVWMSCPGFLVGYAQDCRGMGEVDCRGHSLM